MPLNLLQNFSGDIEAIIADGLLPLTQNRLVLYPLGEPIKMPKGRGTTYTKVRFNRLPLPNAPLQEAVPAAGNSVSISEVSVTVQQWGGLLIFSDRSTYTIKHDVMMKGRELISIQAAELLERNTFNTMFAFTQINTANSVGSRAALTAANTLSTNDLERSVAQLSNLGAYEWLGTEDVNPKIDARRDADALSRKMPSPHFIAVMHRFVASDLRSQGVYQQSSAFSDINKIYNSEVGQLAGCRVVSSNMCPFFVGSAAINGTASSAGGTLPTGNYYIVVTESDPMRQYEQNIHQVSSVIAVTGPNGSISVVLPSNSFTYNVYIGTSASPMNLGVSSAGPLSGTFQGQATQLAGGQTITLTGIGVAQVPPAAPSTGVTVYPTWIFGKYAYSQIVLDDIQVQYLDKADHADPFNQLRELTWKVDYGTLPENNLFVVRIESASAFGPTFQ